MRSNEHLSFSIAEYRRRLATLREVLSKRKLDAIIVTAPENILYLSGYQSFGYYYFQALIVPLEGEPFMVVRMMEAGNAEALSWVEAVRPYSDSEEPITILRYALAEFGLGSARLGYEKHGYFFRASEQEQLFVTAPDATFVDCSGCVEAIRLVKSEEELACVRESARITEAAMQSGIEAVAAGVAENEVAAKILNSLTAAGSEYPASPPVVASGWRSALAHPSWQRRAIGAGECVLLELGANINGYHTALMRTVYTGEPPPEITDAERLLQDALRVSLEMIRPGIAAGDVDVQNRYLLDRYAHGSHVGSRTGFSMGLAFPPHWGEGEVFSIQPGSAEHFQENMVLYIVPWLQVPGRFSIGLSETVWVTAEGCQPLTHVERRVFLR